MKKLLKNVDQIDPLKHCFSAHLKWQYFVGTYDQISGSIMFVICVKDKIVFLF